MKTEALGQVGPGVYSSGANQPIRQDGSGALVLSQRLGRYFEETLRYNSFSAANQAAQAVSAALATTYTGLLLYNPVGSGKTLIPLKVKYALTVAPVAIASIGLIAGFAATGGVTTQTTALTPQNGMIGNTSRSVGIALSAATIVTPTWLRQLVDGFTAAALPAPSPLVELDGLTGILPGGFIAVGALTAVTGLGSIDWIERNFIMD